MELVVKNLPAVQEMQIWSLSREDPLEEGMATHSSILAWKIPWTEEPGGVQFMGPQKVRHDWALEHTYTHRRLTLNLFTFTEYHHNFLHSSLFHVWYIC